MYDVAIIGAGAAGLQLAMKMAEDAFFDSQKILIIDKDEKTGNDHTWSFWEKGPSPWDQIALKQWNKTKFYGLGEDHTLNLGSYTYKTIRSAAFYAYAKKIIRKSQNIEWLTGEVSELSEKAITVNEKEYSARHIFDSRIPPSFFEQKDNYHTLNQHFLGWIIETEKAVFDPDTFVMMDYRVKWKEDTSFTYVLPLSPHKALVEFTLFNTTILEKAEYEAKLKAYITRYLQDTPYTLLEEEQGVIPMSDYPFQKHHTSHVTKIGTAGGWVRPSSGYSFKNADRYTDQIIKNLKKGRRPSQGVATSRFRFYDKVLLRVLKVHNERGEAIFHSLYTKNTIESLFRFLDEQSTLLEEVRIMSSQNNPLFRRSLLQSIFGS